MFGTNAQPRHHLGTLLYRGRANRHSDAEYVVAQRRAPSPSSIVFEYAAEIADSETWALAVDPGFYGWAARV